MRISLDEIGSAKVLAGSSPLVLGLRIALDHPDDHIEDPEATWLGLAFLRGDRPRQGYRRLDECLPKMPIYGRLAYALHSVLGAGAYMVEFSVKCGCCIILHASFEPGSDKLKAVQTIEEAWLEYPSLREEEQATVLFVRRRRL